MNLFKKLIAALYKDILELRAAVSAVNSPDDTQPLADKVHPPSAADLKGRRLYDELSALHCEEGLHQLRSLQHKYRNFNNILMRQLDPGEMTFSRYAAVAEQVYLGALDNLEAAALALRSISAVDISGLRGRLTQLDDNSDSGEPKQALQQRLTSHQEQTARVTEWLAQNENALTALDRAATELAAVRIARGGAAVDLDTAMEELDRLAKRAQRYALDPDH